MRLDLCLYLISSFIDLLYEPLPVALYGVYVVSDDHGIEVRMLSFLEADETEDLLGLSGRACWLHAYVQNLLAALAVAVWRRLFPFGQLVRD